MTSGSPFESVSELGPERSAHRVKRSHLRGVGLLGVLLVGAGIALLVSGAKAAIQASAQGLVGNALAGGLAGSFALPLLGFGGWCLYTAWSNRGAAVTVFERGLAVSRGESVRRIPWDEVIAVEQTLSYHSGGSDLHPREYTIQLTDGTRYAWDEKYEDLETLGEAIAIRTNFANLLRAKRGM